MSAQTPITWHEDGRKVNWVELAELIRLAPLGERKPDDLELAFANSMFKCFAFDEATLVGAGRVLADGVDAAYLCDVVVLPSHQGMGLGKEIVRRLVAQSKVHRKIILYAAPGKEPLYEKFGFRRMTTAMAIFEDPTQAEARGYLVPKAK